MCTALIASVTLAERIGRGRSYSLALIVLGALYCYGRASSCLGPPRATLLATPVPTLSTATGALALNEAPSTLELLGAALPSSGER